MEERGCTANVLLYVPADSSTSQPAMIYCANAGDARCVAASQGKAQALSFDHKPTNPGERSRIQKAGGFVNNEGRVNGNLNLSRAIGDLTYKKNKRLSAKEQQVIAFPDVRTLIVSSQVDFVVMGCDGIWEQHTNQQTVDSIYGQMRRKIRINKICDNWLDTCLSPNVNRTMGKGCDNMSMILIDFRKLMQTTQ